MAKLFLGERRMGGLRQVFVAVAWLACLSGAAAAADTYPIKLHRSVKPGDAVNVDVQIEQSRKVTISAGPGDVSHQDDGMKGSLQGRVDVSAVDGKGEPSVFTITVKSLTDAEAKPLAEEGVVISVRREIGSVDFSSNGAPLSDAAKQVLSLIYDPLGPDGAANDDDVFGTTTPRKAGESWPVNAATAAKSLSRSGTSLKPEDVAGEVALKGVDKTAAGDVLHVAGTFNAKKMQPAVPAGATPGDSSVTASFDGHFPADPNALPLDTTITMDIHVAFTLQGQADTGDIHVSKKEAFTAVKQ